MSLRSIRSVFLSSALFATWVLSAQAEAVSSGARGSLTVSVTVVASCQVSLSVATTSEASLRCGGQAPTAVRMTDASGKALYEGGSVKEAVARVRLEQAKAEQKAAKDENPGPLMVTIDF